MHIEVQLSDLDAFIREYQRTALVHYIHRTLEISELCESGHIS